MTTSVFKKWQHTNLRPFLPFSKDIETPHYTLLLRVLDSIRDGQVVDLQFFHEATQISLQELFPAIRRLGVEGVLVKRYFTEQRRWVYCVHKKDQINQGEK